MGQVRDGLSVIGVSTRTAIIELNKVDVLGAVDEPLLEQSDLQQVEVELVPVKLVADTSPLEGELDQIKNNLSYE